MKKNLWILPALASLLFFTFSLEVVLTEGPWGFWVEHTARNGWGYQIFIDLVSAATIGLLFASPQARKYGVRPAPWVVLTILTGSIGLWAFVARILYAKETKSAAALIPSGARA